MKYQNLRLLRLIICGLILAVTITLHAASIDMQCGVSSGFNFAADNQSQIGYITSLTIGSSTLRSDFSVKDPTTGTSIQVVAVLSKVSWAGGQSDSISFNGQVSTTNKQTLALLLHQAMSNTQVQIGFKVFTYDPIAKKYYKSFFPATDATLKGLIAKSGTAPQLTIASSQSSESSKFPDVYGRCAAADFANDSICDRRRGSGREAVGRGRALMVRAGRQDRQGLIPATLSYHTEAGPTSGKGKFSGLMDGLLADWI